LKPSLPVWADGLIVQVLVPLCMWLSSSELWASLLAFAWLFARLFIGAPFERQRLLLAILFGLIFEVSLWRTGACLYQNPGVLYVPLWIFPLWAAGGLMICGVAAPQEWESPAHRWLVLLPFALHWVLPSNWVASLLAALSALVVAALAWRGLSAPSLWGRVLRIGAVGVGGTSASFGFGYAAICVFPQEWYGLPPWGLSLWTSLAVVLIGLRR